MTFTVAGLALASRYLTITNHIVLVTAALSPYLMLFGPLSVILLTFARRWIFAGFAIALTMATLAVELPLYRSSGTAPAAGVELRVMSANLEEGQADPNDVVKSAREQADILALQELTPQEADRLSAAGLDTQFPYRWLDPRPAGSGVGVWSRLPMHTTKRLAGYTKTLVAVRIRVVGIAIDPTVVVAHIAGPWPQPIDDWRRDLAHLPITLLEVAKDAGGGSVIVAGDLNSTIDMRAFRGLLRDGYGDAAQQSGAGIEPTFPADWRLPPLIAIDHVLIRSCTAASLHTIKIPGSDHRALATTVLIPRSSSTHS